MLDRILCRRKQLCDRGDLHRNRGAYPCFDGGEIEVRPGFYKEVVERVVFFSDSDALTIERGNMEGNGRIKRSHRVDVGRGRGCRPRYVGSGADGCAAI